MPISPESESGPLDPKVVILAGGFGTRLAERTDEIPKPMVEIGGQPILWHILKIYGHYGFNDFVIAAGYRGEVIKRYFLEYRQRAGDLAIDFVTGAVDLRSTTTEPWRVSIVDTGAETMTGGRLRRLAAELGDGPFLCTYGDGLANVDLHGLLRFHAAHGRAATLTAVRPPSPFGRPQLDGDRVVSFTEKAPGDDEWISGGYFVLDATVLDRIAGDETSFEMETLPRLAADDQLRAFRHEGFWHPMDTLRDMRNLNRLWAQPAPPWKVWS